MSRIRINPSPHGTPGEVVAVEDRQVVWVGPISELRDAGSFDALYCHDVDEERLSKLVRGTAGRAPGGPDGD